MAVMRSLVLVVLLAVVLATTRTAAAGRWCHGGDDYAPTAGSTLPVHPRVIKTTGDTLFEGKLSKRARAPKITATIDGKKVPISIKTTRIRSQVIQTIEIKSDKTGELVVKAGKDDEASWTISSEWTAPEKVNASVSRYHVDRMIDNYSWYDGAQLTLDQPALTLRAKWRRDSEDKWRTVTVPVILKKDESILVPGRKPAPPAIAALLGETACDDALIPVEFLERGVEIEATALLPNGKEVPVALPNPLVIEKRKKDPRDFGNPLGD